MRTKISKLHLFHRKSFLVILAAELILLAFGIAGLFGKNAVYEYGRESMSAVFGEYREDLGGVYTDASYGLTGNLLNFSNLTLPKGFYKVALHYETDTDYKNLCSVDSSGMGYKGCYTNGESLHAGLSSTDFGMWLMRDTDNLNVQVSYEEGSLLVTGLTITRSNALQRMYLFGLICLILVINSAYVFRAYDGAYGVSKENKSVIFGILMITVFASLPVMVDYALNSGDLIYHLMRIEGLKDGILSGQFPVRIAPKWLEDHGYADAIFYGQIMLLPAAIFRIIGFTVLTSYRMYIVLLNLATALMAYFCFKGIWKSKYAALLSSMLYTLSVYRICKTFMTGALGETLGILFLPLALYGFYRIFTMDTRDRRYKWSFLPLALGFAGLVQSHLLSAELAGGFGVLLCIVLWKRVFRRQTLLELVKSVLCCILLSAWFLVPFADYMLTGDFVIQHVSARTIQERGLYLAHLFSSLHFAGGNAILGETGMQASMPYGVGFALLAVWLLWLYLLFVQKKRFQEKGYLERRELAAGVIAAVFAGIAMVMSLEVFPWDWLQSTCRPAAVLVSSLQFPHRTLTIATLLLVLLAGLLYRAAERCGDKKWCCGVGGLLIGLTLLTSLFTMDDALYKIGFTRIYNAAGMGYGYISGAEYLPYGTDQTQLVYHDPDVSENVTLEGWEKGALSYDVGCVNDSSQDGYLQLPLLYYKGYQAYDGEAGERLEVYDGDNHFVSVRIPAGYSGIVTVRFVSPWYWRLAELVSALSLIGVVLLYRRSRAQRRRKSL